jgi:hypothetical protein
MILFDAARVPARGRAEALHSVLLDVTAPTVVVYESPRDGIRCRVDYREFGLTNLVASCGTGFQLLLTPRQVRLDCSPVVALSMQTSGEGRFEHLGQRHRLNPGGLMLVDLAAPYEFGWSRTGGKPC